MPVGLNPIVPEKAAGIFADPAESELIPKAAHLLAIDPAYPPDDPPLINPFLYGLDVRP